MEVSFLSSRPQRRWANFSIFTIVVLIFYPCVLSAQEDPPLSSAESAPSAAPSSLGFSPEVLASFANVALPAVSQLLGGNAGEGGAGEGASVEGLQELGKKAAASLSLSSPSAREGLLVPANELFGALKDLMGAGTDDGRGVQATARMLMPLQIPLLQLAGERMQSTDLEEDRKALKIATETPPAKKVLQAYLKQEPDRQLRSALSDLAVFQSELKKYVSALQQATQQQQMLPVSLLAAVDVLGVDISNKVNGYLSTLARYLLFVDRFPKNKKSLAFFARLVLPRVLQLFAMQLEACRLVWASILSAPAAAAAAAAVAAAADGRSSAETAEAAHAAAAAAVGASFKDGADDDLAVAESETDAAFPTFYDEDIGPGLAVLRFFGLKPKGQANSYGRGIARRLLTRVRAHVADIRAISLGALAATSVSFQLEFAAAVGRASEGVSNQEAFGALLQRAHELAGASETVEAVKSSKNQNRLDPRTNALRRGRTGEADQA